MDQGCRGEVGRGEMGRKIGKGGIEKLLEDMTGKGEKEREGRYGVREVE